MVDLGALIIFSLTPNSAAAERIFSQMKDMFGDKRASALADMLQAAMMLRYHNLQCRNQTLKRTGPRRTN